MKDNMKILKRLESVERELRELREEINSGPLHVEMIDPKCSPTQWQPYYWPAQYSPQSEWDIYVGDEMSPPSWTVLT